MPYRSRSAVIPLDTGGVVAKPAGVVSGDLLVCLISSDGFNAAAISGWDTPNLTVQNITFDNQNLQIIVKTAGGAEPSDYTITNVSLGCACIMAFSGYSGTIVEGTPGVDNAGSGDPISAVAPSITIPSGSYDLLYFAALDQNTDEAWAFTPPSGMTARVTASEAGQYSGFGAATIDGVATGATGTKTGTFTGGSGQAGNAAVLIGIPATGGGGGPTFQPAWAVGANQLIETSC